MLKGASDGIEQEVQMLGGLLGRRDWPKPRKWDVAGQLQAPGGSYASTVCPSTLVPRDMQG